MTCQRSQTESAAAECVLLCVLLLSILPVKVKELYIKLHQVLANGGTVIVLNNVMKTNPDNNKKLL